MKINMKAAAHYLIKHWPILCSYLAGFLILFLTDPKNLPLVLLLLPFALFFIAFMLSAKAIINYFGSKNSKTTRRKHNLFAAIIAAFPILLLLLQSTGRLSLADFILIIVLFAVLWFYAGRLTTD
jgi:hypothetical protein